MFCYKKGLYLIGREVFVVSRLSDSEVCVLPYLAIMITMMRPSIHISVDSDLMATVYIRYLRSVHLSSSMIHTYLL